MPVMAPCPYCDVEINALAVFDPDRGANKGQQACPECNAPRRIIQYLADGHVTHDDCRERYGRIELDPAVRRELQEQLEETDDPADRNQYLEELGVDEDAAEVEA